MLITLSSFRLSRSGGTASCGIPELAQRSTAFLNDLILQGGLSSTIKRVGNNVISSGSGGSSVLAHVDQLDAGIDGIGIAQGGMQAGLVGLKNRSMVTLGFSAVSTGPIAAQSSIWAAS